jgi:hypothetical protein
MRSEAYRELITPRKSRKDTTGLGHSHDRHPMISAARMSAITFRSDHASRPCCQAWSFLPPRGGSGSPAGPSKEDSLAMIADLNRSLSSVRGLRARQGSGSRGGVCSPSLRGSLPSDSSGAPSAVGDERLLRTRTLPSLASSPVGRGRHPRG